MNGLIHNSAQEVYGYGRFSFPKENACDKKVYSLVCRQIDRMVIQFKPKELILCIDGVAPRSKPIQQRQRRFLAAHDRKKPGTEFNFDCNKGNTSKFDSNSISPEPHLCITLEDILTFILNRSKTSVYREGNYRCYTKQLEKQRTKLETKRYSRMV